MKAQETWDFAHRSLQEGQGIALLVVAQNTPGSPGRRGFKMVLNTAGKRHGTIGGGIMEYKLTKRAAAALAEQQRLALCLPQLHQALEAGHSPSAWQPSGMICAGSQVVLLYTFFTADAEFFAELSRLSEPHQPPETQPHLAYSPEGLQLVPQAPTQTGAEAFFAADFTQWLYHERLGAEFCVFIAGGGHVALATSRVLATLGAHITVFDHRPELDTMAENTYAQRLCVGPYSDIPRYLSEGPRTYALVLTTAFTSDVEALRYLAGKNLGFLGVMGSRAKLAKIRETLQAKGLSEKQLRQIKGPIGLDIHSRSCEEIGVSIAAELIKIKNSA